MDKFFKITERGSTMKTEVFAGITTFFAMAYIIFVNPDQVAAGGVGANAWLVGSGADPVAMGKIWNAVYIASILVAVIGTLLMALYANMPFAQACGMGLNSFFCTTFVAGAFSAQENVVTGYQSGLVIIFLSGVVFLILSVTGLREYIAKSMPECLKKAIPAGIGLFIAMIGFKNAGIIEDNQYTFVQFFDFHGRIDTIGTVGPDGQTVTGMDVWRMIVPVIIALIGILIIAILAKYGVKANVIIGIVASAVLYWVFMWELPPFDVSGIGQSFKDFAEVGFLGLFNGDAWDAAFNSSYIGGAFSAVMLIIVFCLVDMFDTVGTIYGTASQANMLDENGDPININKSMMCDSVGTLSGALLGTSTCTTFVESASGVSAGGRTGFASVVTAACFAVCLFLSPLASIVPSCATAPALIYVGVLMAKNFAKVDMEDMLSAVPAFLALIMMPLTYSISNGIGIGAIAYVIIAIFSKKYTKKDIVVTVIAALFVAKFIFVTM
ncbi:MAG: NCS2 family permease [Lachnospiraceae bacterium]|nr:NCS2 family permease [Lachnospiraceae bacterium]